jgi:uncharacterized protein (DUF2141 family)
MKQFPLRVALLFVIATTSLVRPAYSETCPVILRVQGFRNHVGRLGVTVFNQPDGWPEENGKAFFHDSFPISGDQTVARLTLPEGRYAIAVLHDENSNHKLDRNFIGIPKEGFGFSNNPRVHLTAPAFDIAALPLACPTTEVSIQLIYK